MLFVSALRGSRNEVSGVIIVIRHPERPFSLHPLHVTPKPCRMRRHPDHHSRCLLAQFGLTPKPRRGMAESEVVDEMCCVVL